MAGERRRRVGPARTQRRRRVALIAVGLAVCGLGVAAYATNLLRTAELSTIDARFSIRGPQKAPSNIVLVEIDGPTFTEIGGFLWPFPRQVDAKVISDVAAEHPKAIAFDVQTSERSTCQGATAKKPPPPGDCPQAVNDEKALLLAMQNADGRTIMTTTEVKGHGQFAFLGSPGNALVSAVGSHIGSGLFPQDPGGVDRRVQYAPNGIPSLGVATVEVAEHRKISPAAFNGANGAWIDYAGPTGSFRSVSFGDVYAGNTKAVPPGLFHNKIVVIGPSAQNLQDLHPTPFSALMPGAEVQANSIATVLRNLPLRSDAGWLNIALIILLGLATPLLSLRFGPIPTLALFGVLGAAFTVAVQLAFDSGRIVTFVVPALALVVSTAGAIAIQLVTVAFERERVRDLFSRFVPEDVVGEVLAATGDGLRLGGVQRLATVMFTDLRGFTSSAENMTPDNVIEVLNVYLSEMSDAILDHGGTLVAYMGDGIMAVFGAPIERPDHADRALATAREMLSVRLPRFNEWMKEHGLGEGYRMGIGLNTGRVLSGNVGSERRVEYTAVGDATNTAARIEALTKGTPHQLMFSEATKEAFSTPPQDILFVQEVQIRGRRQMTSIWSVVEGTDAEAVPALSSTAPAAAQPETE